MSQPVPMWECHEMELVFLWIHYLCHLITSLSYFDLSREVMDIEDTIRWCQAMWLLPSSKRNAPRERKGLSGGEGLEMSSQRLQERGDSKRRNVF